MSPGNPQSKHPAEGVFKVLTSTFAPVVRGHFLDIASNGDELGPGQIFEVEPNLPQPSDPVPIDEFRDISPNPARVLLSGVIQGRRFEIELFEGFGTGRIRVVVGKGVDSSRRQATDVWVAEDDDDDFVGGP